jgi:hypothetical protein
VITCLDGWFLWSDLTELVLGMKVSALRSVRLSDSLKGHSTSKGKQSHRYVRTAHVRRSDSSLVSRWEWSGRLGTWRTETASSLKVRL